MKRNAGRPRNVRIKHGGRRHPKSGRPAWTRKERFEDGPTKQTEALADACAHAPWDDCDLCWDQSGEDA